MTFTTLRKTAEGVLFLPQHLERLFAFTARAEFFVQQFKEQLAREPVGIVSIAFDNSQLTFTHRTASSLFEGIAMRKAVSPITGNQPIPKSASPSEYDAFRVPEIATLLTDATGNEVYESSVSAILAWNGVSLVAVPDDRPRVQSIAEKEIAARIHVQRIPIVFDAHWPLLLVNAVGCVEPRQAPAFPPALRTSIDAVYRDAVSYA